MNRLKKYIISVGSVLLVVCLVFFSAAPSAFAVSDYALGPLDVPISFPCSEPYVSSTTGYIALATWRASISSHSAFIFFYQISVINQSYEYNTDPLMVIDDVGSYNFKLHFEADEYSTYKFSYGFIHTDGTIQNINSFQFQGDSEVYTVSFNSSHLITNADFHGNIDTSALSSDLATFNYLFTEDKYEYLYLYSIALMLEEMGGLSEEQLATLDNILSSVSTTNAKLELIITTFGDQLSDLVTNSDAILSHLINLYGKVDSIDKALFLFYTECIDALWILDSDVLLLFDEQMKTNQKLDELYALIEDIFTVSTETTTYPEYTEFQSEIAQEKSEIDNVLNQFTFVSEDFFGQFDISHRSLTFIWDVFEQIMATHENLWIYMLALLILGFVSFLLMR